MKKIICFASLCTIGTAFSQTGKVGVNTNTPTEIFDANGTARFRELPANGTANAIYNGAATKATTFTATRTVVADANGVLGTVAGLPSAGGGITAVNGTSPITATTSGTTTTIGITRNDLTTVTSAPAATTPVIITNGAGAVVNGANTTIGINNTAPLWNANQIQNVTVSTIAPTNGQVLGYNGTTWVPTTPTVASPVEPWNRENTNTAADSNNQNIYQNGRVGVGATSATNLTENLDVNGTARVRQLPTNGATNAIFTNGANSAAPSRSQTFNAVSTVVADANGVFGISNGLPATNNGLLVTSTVSDPTSASQNIVFTNSDRQTIDLPTASNFKNQSFSICHANQTGSIGINNVSVVVGGATNNATMQVSWTNAATTPKCVRVQSDGSRWWVVGF